MFSRIALFLLANFSVLAVLSVSSRVLGLDAYLASQGMGINGLLIMAAVFGFAGSFISLAMSKWLAKKSMGVKVIEQPAGRTEIWLVETVRRQASEAGIGMPEVGVFDSPQPNAFATGMSKNSALVAVSSGLLQTMTEGEAEAVLGHEISHVANGDMLTMGLLQGVLNTFVIFFSRIIGTLVDRTVFKVERDIGPGYFIGSIVAEMLLGILAAMIAMWFSRYREFHADAGGARLAGRDKMIAALRRLQSISEPRDLPGQLAAFGIVGGIGQGLKKLMMSHPPLEQRIKTLEGAS
ncbi:MAG: protease HtpX [Gammaproteobacteria bacterium]|nr:protease HtpX [Gammaproteobacteria bacterium]MBA3731114.1 protease HtpX [Gammaproteobacteria bacterium]